MVIGKQYRFEQSTIDGESSPPNPCADYRCADYDEENDVCLSDGGCGHGPKGADSESKTCRYKQESGDENVWSCTKCVDTWSLESGNPFENHMNYCPRCGRYIEMIVKVRYCSVICGYENIVMTRREAARGIEMTERTCGTCKYSEWAEDGHVCVNADSDRCTEYVQFADGCDEWTDRKI